LFILHPSAFILPLMELSTPPALRFVVLRHDGIDAPHFDLMLETAPGSPLMTWRSERWPIDRPTPLVKLGDHRRDFLDYQGPLSGGRGFVTRVDGGTVCWHPQPGDQNLHDVLLAGATRRRLWLRSSPGDATWEAAPANEA
jgi:hypothetical protein